LRKIIVFILLNFSILWAHNFDSPVAGAMGTAYASIGSGVEAVCYNPASVAYSSDFQLYSSFVNKYHIANYYSFLSIVRLSKFEILKLVPSFYYVYENGGGILEKHFMNFTIGNVVFQKYYLGIDVNYSFFKIGKLAENSEGIQSFDKKFEADFGVLISLIDNLKIGLVLNHFLSFNDSFQVINSPKEITLGSSYYIDGVGGISLDISAESKHNFYKEDKFNYTFLTPKLGIEKSLGFLNMVVRAGLNGLFNPTFGAGFKYGKIAIDYAFLYKLNGSHSLALTYTF